MYNVRTILRLLDPIPLVHICLRTSYKRRSLDYFPVVNAKGNDALLGVDSLGINFYSVEDKFNPKVSFPWSEIAKISATKTEFVVSCTSNANDNTTLRSF